jgi:hypothetical protein
MIQCPWGCTEYYHKAELFDFSSVYLRFLGSMLKVLKGSTVDALESVKEDYIDSIDYLLLNPDWPITPCVVISSDRCPYVLVCQDHPKGSKLDYIHPLWSPNGMLPGKQSDQNAHAIVVPRTISPMKAKAHLTTFQMHEMCGSFVGLDTMTLTDYGKFNFLSYISGQDELLSYFVEDQTSGVSSLDMLLWVLFLHGWLRTTLIGHLLSDI